MNQFYCNSHVCAEEKNLQLSWLKENVFCGCLLLDLANLNLFYAINSQITRQFICIKVRRTVTLIYCMVVKVRLKELKQIQRSTYGFVPSRLLSIRWNV